MHNIDPHQGCPTHQETKLTNPLFNSLRAVSKHHQKLAKNIINGGPPIPYHIDPKGPITPTLTTNDIHDKLAIPGYKTYLPPTWDKHGQARIIVYANEELQVKPWYYGKSVSDLPFISFLISVGREKKTVLNSFYREFTGGVSGLNDVNAQNER